MKTWEDMQSLLFLQDMDNGTGSQGSNLQFLIFCPIISGKKHAGKSCIILYCICVKMFLILGSLAVPFPSSSSSCVVIALLQYQQCSKSWYHHRPNRTSIDWCQGRARFSKVLKNFQYCSLTPNQWRDFHQPQAMKSVCFHFCFHWFRRHVPKKSKSPGDLKTGTIFFKRFPLDLGSPRSLGKPFRMLAGLPRPCHPVRRPTGIAGLAVGWLD